MSAQPRISLPAIAEFAQDATFEDVVPPSSPSPAAQMQWHLYQRITAERPTTIPQRYPLPVRLALLAAAGTSAWLLVFAIARLLLSVLA